MDMNLNWQVDFDFPLNEHFNIALDGKAGV